MSAFIFNSKNPEWDVPFIRCCVCLKIMRGLSWDDFPYGVRVYCTDDCYKVYKDYCYINEEPDVIY